MIVKFKLGARQRLTEADITAFEARIGKPLPEDYRQHMLQWNGGGVEQLYLEHRDWPGGSDFGLSSLYAIDYAPNTLEGTLEILLRVEDIDEGYFPIGSTRGGGGISHVVKR